MAGKHYKWHKRWQLDATARTATHSSGLACMFEPLPIAEDRADALEADGWNACGTCWHPGDPSQRWGTLARSQNMQATLDTLSADNGAGNAPQMLARLTREAGDIWAHHLERQHLQDTGLASHRKAQP